MKSTKKIWRSGPKNFTTFNQSQHSSVEIGSKVRIIYRSDSFAIWIDYITYRISSYSFQGNYWFFFNLEIVANSNSCNNISFFLLNKLKFSCGNYSREKITQGLKLPIWGKTVPSLLFEFSFRYNKQCMGMECDCEVVPKGLQGCGETCLNRQLLMECPPTCNNSKCSNKRFQVK